MLSKIIDWFREESDEAQAWVLGGSSASEYRWRWKRVAAVGAAVLVVLALVVGSMTLFSSSPGTEADNSAHPSGAVNVEVPVEDDPESSSSPTSEVPSTTEAPATSSESSAERTPSRSTSATPSTSSSRSSSGSNRQSGSDKIGKDGGTFETPGRGHKGPRGNANKAGVSIVYTVVVINSTSSGPLTITYIDGSGSPQQASGKNSWNKEFTSSTARPTLGVAASSSSGPVTCMISVDGIVASTQSSTKAGEKVTCGNA